jgi:hypothetical protein
LIIARLIGAGCSADERELEDDDVDSEDDGADLVLGSEMGTDVVLGSEAGNGFAFDS